MNLISLTFVHASKHNFRHDKKFKFEIPIFISVFTLLYF